MSDEIDIKLKNFITKQVFNSLQYQVNELENKHNELKELITKPHEKCRCGNAEFNILKINFGPPISYNKNDGLGVSGLNGAVIGDFKLKICKRCHTAMLEQPPTWKII